MIEVKPYIQTLFNTKGLIISPNRQDLFDQFVQSTECEDSVKIILEKQKELMEKWKIKNRIADIMAQQIVIPNATIGKNYEVKIDFLKHNLVDLIYKDFDGLEQIGFKYNKETDTIVGTPTQSGEIKIKFLFKIEGESDSTQVNEKIISIIVNPDPKTLWKDIPSDINDLFWKEDDVSKIDSLGDKKIVVASKRGRSHKNVGSFRDDDFSFKHIEATGWSVVAVSDGAGSYSLSRKGSQIACDSIIDYFDNYYDIEKSIELEGKITEYSNSKNETLLKEIEILAKQNLYKATVHVHNKIKEHSEKTYKSIPELFNNPKAKSYIDYYHSTLIFALYKKYEFGYLILTFGVGDCPIAIVNKEETETYLLNWLDVGEFGGGTRFITQSEIFHSTENPMASRFTLKILPDFSYLFLMTDGIYDPKFVVEANLEKHEKWKEFIADLKGGNDDNIKVEFDYSNNEIATQLSQWMDFWSPGNHDDRTLAIIF
jgi:serine/threonine protein phosphatase PrpC